MTTRLLENGRDLGLISGYERHGGEQRTTSAMKEPDWCDFIVPLACGMSLSKGIQHSLSFANGTTVPIRVSRVTGGIDGARVTAFVP